MKKKLLVFSLIILLTATSTTALAGPYRHGPAPRYHHHRHHPGGHVRYHHRHAGDYWAAWGIGLFTGAVISEIFFRPPPPTVVYETGPVVVERYTPPVQTAPEVTSGKVAVGVGALNVRSGPGLNHTIISFVRMGDVLEVSETAPGWLYVRTPSGYTGWVMAQFTRTFSPSAG